MQQLLRHSRPAATLHMRPFAMLFEACMLQQTLLQHPDAMHKIAAVATCSSMVITLLRNQLGCTTSSAGFEAACSGASCLA